MKFSGIIPGDWELAQPPAVNANLAQLSFNNGVNLLAQPRSVTFLQALTEPQPRELAIAVIARRYLEKLPHANYRGLNIAPRLLLGFPGYEDAARRFITEHLLTVGPWQEIGQAPVRAAVTLNYQLEHCPLSLAINEVRLQQTETESVAALLFAGSFNYVLEAETTTPLASLQQWLANWPADLQTFRNLLSQRFLTRANTAAPPPKNPSRATGSSLFPQL